MLSVVVRVVCCALGAVPCVFHAMLLMLFVLWRVGCGVCCWVPDV